MTNAREESCSGLDDELQVDAEFRAVLNSLFCACLPEAQRRAVRLRRDLFLRCDIKGQTLAEATSDLGLDPGEAAAMLMEIRRDIAVLMALGLCQTGGAEEGRDQTPACGCGTPDAAADAGMRQTL